ncbi:tetratricopeptide repeat protein [Paracrocinitomix mangrovi]|uniref:tetratricopeptide repeat protein n=1 Tax=Paracrocinitomix mangrovi TaxID=2862509 RepID=UPI001C8E9EA1|nr:tetratricopeptide repeat protein [Paracrocinitomix mangrovi]UKN03540.1 tetratricopeptide repeat protein [Paracrocinitomix mangrovi]
MTKFIFVFIYFLAFSAYSQDWEYYADWENEENSDSVRITGLYHHTWSYLYTNPDSTIYYVDILINECFEKGDAIWLSNAYGAKGAAYYMKSDFQTAIDELQNSIRAADFIDTSSTDPQVKELYYLAKSNSMNTIGAIYMNIDQNVKAKEYFIKSLSFDRLRADTSSVFSTYNNLGVIERSLGNYEKSKTYLRSVIGHDLNKGDTLGAAFSYINLGGVYMDLKDYDSAAYYYYLAEDVFENHEDGKYGLADTYVGIGIVEGLMGNPAKGITYCEKALNFSMESHDMQTIVYCHDCLHENYKKKGDFKNALKHHELYLSNLDSLTNDEQERALIQKEVSFGFEKKQLQDSLNLIKQKEVSEAQLNEKDAQLKQENTIKIAVSFGGFLVAIFAFVIYRRLKVTREQKAEIEHQKHIVDEKNQEILDSINYAKRLQQAILPPDKLVKSHIPNSFILYLPKDIVAGDFYWFANDENKQLIAAADCTGHGVPGALVSVVCHNALNRSFREYQLKEPGLILDKTREIVIEEFEKSEEEVKDGMDIALLSVARTKSKDEGEKITVQFAGANNPLWLVRNGELIEIKADKQPIGKYADQKPFTTHDVEVQKGDCLYMFSDGFADQFGGDKGKKYKYKPFKSFLAGIAHLEMDEQKAQIEEEFESWKSGYEQLDDLCVIGVKV